MPVIINGSTGISGTDGSAATPAVQGTDGNTGMFFPAADQIAFAEGGVEAMRLDASGNVGIGTATPGTGIANRVLAINGTDAGIHFLTSGADTNRIYSSSGELRLQTATAIPLVFYTNNAERARITSGGDFQFNSGYGSVATAYGCRAWVNFNGTGTVAIRASGNVSSITDNGTGDYTVNFTNAMPNANFATVVSGCFDNVAVGTGNTTRAMIVNNAATGSVRVGCPNAAGSPSDFEFVNVSVFR